MTLVVGASNNNKMNGDRKAMDKRLADYGEDLVFNQVEQILNDSEAVLYAMNESPIFKKYVPLHNVARNEGYKGISSGAKSFLSLTLLHELQGFPYNRRNGPENWFHLIHIDQCEVGSILEHRSTHESIEVVKLYSHGKCGFQWIGAKDLATGKVIQTSTQHWEYVGIVRHH